jgi:zinc transport system permease protein
MTSGSSRASRPVALAILAATWSRLAYATFDAELATLSGVPVAALDYLLLALVAVVIVVAVKTVGVALVSSFVIIPAATARMIGKTLPGVALVALGLGAGGAAVGLFLSYHLDVASGATIILVMSTVFAVTVLARGKK